MDDVVKRSYLCRLCQVLCSSVDDVATLLPGQHAVQEPLVLLAPPTVGCDERLTTSQEDSLKRLVVITGTGYCCPHHLKTQFRKYWNINSWNTVILASSNTTTQ